jgi:protein-S-isoprenylcysteine O-methyltransferase Ste14
MPGDQTFRRILFIGCAMLVSIGMYYRLRSRTGEKLDRLQEGLFILIALRALGLLGFMALITYFANPAWLTWAAVPVPVWLRWAGVTLGLFTGCLIAWTFQSLGSNLTDTVVTRKEHTLVMTGPYRWARHPFYTSAALAILSISLVAANVLFFVIGSFTFLLLVIRTRKEEANLVARFGDEYRAFVLNYPTLSETANRCRRGELDKTSCAFGRF